MSTTQTWLSLAAVGLVSAGTLAYAKKDSDANVKLADCPAAVQKTFEREAKGSAIEHVEKEVKNGKTVYEADVKINGVRFEVKIAEDGTLLEKLGRKKSDKKKKQEARLKLADCPEVVQKTLAKEAGQGDVAHVDKESKGDRTTYEADVTVDGKRYEISVASDGSLLSKKSEDDDKKDND